MIDSFRQLNKFIVDHEQLVIVCHHRPDGDAVGSLLAMAHWLERQGKTVRLYCFDAIPLSLGFLAGLEKIQSQVDEFWRQARAVVLVDCGDLSMVGVGAEHFSGKAMAVIDHHVTNPGFGTVNYVDAQASSTAELIYNFFNHNNFTVDKAMATALFLGIYSDTDGFSNLATTPTALQASATLLKLGAHFKDVAATSQNKTVAGLKLWGRALERLRLDPAKGIAVTVIREADLAECQARPEDSEGVASFLNYLTDVKMAMVLRELPDGMIKGSLRTTSELIDVSKVAKLLGGGGHAKAAGFTVKGKIIETDKGWKIV